MLKTTLTREDAFLMLEAGEQLFNESQFNAYHTYNKDKVWALFDATVTMPNSFFIVYNVNDLGKVDGFIILGMGERYFSGELAADDFAVYVAPEKRGSSLFIKMLRVAEQWAIDNGAKEIVIKHNTGIRTEESAPLFPRLGYHKDGYIFSKRLG